jgi:formamidopyrimidine-DNA glycosylase
VPELPEVETVRRTLAPALGAVVAEVGGSGKGLHQGAPVPLPALRRALADAALVGLRRRGKYLLCDFAGDAVLLVHLGMSGRFRLFAPGAPPAPHTHLQLALRDGRTLRFTDPRRFGRIDLLRRADEAAHPTLAALGPDPLVDGVDAAALHAQARRRRTPLKSLLLDQAVLAGVGNIYASEALWLARLRPTRRSDRLTAAQAGALAVAVREVIVFALDHGGTSLRDFVDADGREGENAAYLKVYGRDGAPCPRCGAALRRSVLAGRATYYCPRCQPA